MRANHLLVVVATTSLFTNAPGQCPEWSPGFGAPPAGDGLGALVRSLATFDDGLGPRLYAAGDFDQAGAATVSQLARWDGLEWSPLDNSTFRPGDALLQLLVCDFGAGPRLMVTGDFQMTTSQGATFFAGAVWDGTAWSGDAVGSPSWIDLAVFFDPGTGAGPAVFTWGTAGLGYTDVYRFDGTNWAFHHELTNRPFDAACVADLGGGPRIYLARDGSVTRFDGSSYSGGIPPPMGAETYVNVRDVAALDTGSGLALYAAGSFGSPAPRGFVRRWDGVSWSDVGGSVEQGNSITTVRSLHVHDFGSGPRLVACGHFTSIGGAQANDIAVFDGTSWSALGTGFDFAIAPAPDCAASFDAGDGAGPSLYVGGSFASAGGQPSQHIARWTSCGGPTTLFCFGDGSASACPCGNASIVGDDVGCLNSLGSGGALRTSGQASLSNDTLVLQGSGMTNSTALYYQGANLASGGSGFPFGDGVKCLAGPFRRLMTKANSGGASSYPGAGDQSVSTRGAIGVPGTRHYQVHYRNAAAFCAAETFNLTNGLTVVWQP